MYEVEIVSIKPVILRIVNEEFDVRGDPGRLNRRQIDAQDVCCWELIRNCNRKSVSLIIHGLRTAPSKRTFDCPDTWLELSVIFMPREGLILILLTSTSSDVNYFMGVVSNRGVEQLAVLREG